jgi:hypothetical protein
LQPSNRIGFTIIVATMLILLGEVLLPAADKPDPAPNTLTAAEQAAGWKLLFDGKTTAGWRGFRKDKCPDGWQVIDGTLDRVKQSGDLVTTEHYASFDLVFDWRIARTGNSGVMYHVLEDVDRPGFSGPEYQLLDNVEGADPQRAGWCYALYQPPLDPRTGKPLDTTHPVGQWNTSRILVDGTHVEHWMNGVKYVEYELWSDDWNARVAKSKFAAIPGFAKARTGCICLQDHGGEVAFRNIKIRPIQHEAKSSP